MSAGGALLTDFYQLAMAHAYFASGMREIAVFEVFVRKLPRTRRFLVAAGLEQVVRFLEQWGFSPEDNSYLSKLEEFPADFLDYLATLRFTGSVHAMPEGTPFFANEPILRVTAPIIEAQLIESRVLNLMHFQTLVASKAARCVLAARGRALVDFGMRRAHGAEAAVLAARAAYLAGFDATATVEAAREFGLPLSGTMAHSFIQAHDHESDAFRDFLSARGRDTSLLIDTYDTERGAHRAAVLARTCRALGTRERVRGVRIDSGDLGALSLRVRAILDGEGGSEVDIIASGNIDEYRIEALVGAHAPIDAFGVGTHLVVSNDAPALDMVYKLQEYAGRPRRKRSPGKQTWPGRKQVFRERGARGETMSDCIALEQELLPGDVLLAEVMRNGRTVVPLPTLPEARRFCAAQIAELPARLTLLGEREVDDPVRVSDGLRDLAAELDSAGE